MPYRPDTLDGLQPLYQAVVHGCLAGRQQQACDELYIDRILRGTGGGGNFSTFKLGAIGADLGGSGGVLRQAVEPRLPESPRSGPELDAEPGCV